MLADLRFALRTLAKQPAFSGIAIFTLALAIGLNAALFALINGALLRPIVPEENGALRSLHLAQVGSDRLYRNFSWSEFVALRSAPETFADVAANTFALAGVATERDAVPQRSLVALASENYFTLLGTTPALGRFFTAEETRLDAAAPVAVVSHAFWQRLGGGAEPGGRLLWVNGRSFTIIGVTRPEFSGVSAFTVPDLWLPLGLSAGFHSPFGGATGLDLTDPRSTPLHLLVRLPAGLTPAQAESRLPSLAARLPEATRLSAGETRELVLAKPSRVFQSARPGSGQEITLLATALLGLAGCVLVIANLNLANMLLVRGTARAGEFAVRLALGASRWRVIRQLLIEGLVLALLGGLLGLLFALWLNGLLLAALSAAIRGTMSATVALKLEPDLTVVGVTFVVCALSTLLFSLGPALRSARTGLVGALKNPAGAAGGTALNRLFAGRQLMVIAQLALSFVLLFSAGLFFRGAVKAGGIDLGFDPRGQLVTEVDFSLVSRPPAERSRQAAALLDHLRAWPAAGSVAAATQAPMGNFTHQRRVAPVGADETQRRGISAIHTAVTDGYFATLGVPLLRGREFTAAEARADGPARVAILDETLARRLFPDLDPLGQRIVFPAAPDEALEIVGLVGAHRHEVLESEPSRRVYVPFGAAAVGNTFFHVRVGSGDAARTAALVTLQRSHLREFDATLPVLRASTYPDFIERDDSLWTIRAGAALFAALGLLALLLAVIGTYGVRAYAVAQRTREIGIRMALGARPAEVAALILGHGALQTVVALLAGFGLSLGVGRLLGSFLFEVTALDPATLAATTLLLAIASLLASWLPARRAARVDPMVALRNE